MVELGENQDPSLLTLEDSGGTDQKMVRPGALRPNCTVTRAESMNVEVVVAEVGVEQGGLDMLSYARALAIKQGG
jgi:hypothetical protein